MSKATQLAESFGHRQALVEFLVDLAETHAPNCCQVAGRDIVGRLLAEVGGLTALAALPAGSIQLIGSRQGKVVRHVGDNLLLESHGGFFIQHQLFK